MGGINFDYQRINNKLYITIMSLKRDKKGRKEGGVTKITVSWSPFVTRVKVINNLLNCDIISNSYVLSWSTDATVNKNTGKIAFNELLLGSNRADFVFTTPWICNKISN